MRRGSQLEIYQNEIALESGERLVIGDIVIGGGFQGGGAPAFGAWLDFRVFGTSRYRFDGITISIFEADQQLGLAASRLISSSKKSFARRKEPIGQ